MTFFGCCFCMFIVKHRSCLMNYRRNRVNFDSAVRISILFDLSSRSFIPLSSFTRSRCQTPLLNPYLVFIPHVHTGFFFNSFIGFVKFCTLGFRPFYSPSNTVIISQGQNEHMIRDFNQKWEKDSVVWNLYRLTCGGGFWTTP